MTDAGRSEAQRQQALLASITGGDAGAAPAGLRMLHPAGLRAYRGNARATAARALRAACPRLVVMLGDSAFGAMAAAFWQAHPPQRGDLAEWGDALPAWLAAQPSLAEWPWLADSARLDLAVHRAERAADGSFDAPSLHALADTDPARLHLRLTPGVALLESPWPIALLHRAHAGGAVDDAALEAARAAIACGQGEAVLVTRLGWRVVVHEVAAEERAWLHAVVAGQDLGAALDAAAPGFDFGAWLPQAIGAGVVQGLRVADDGGLCA